MSRSVYSIFAYLALSVLILSNAIWLFPSLSGIREDVAILQLETASRAKDEISNFFSRYVDELGRISKNIAISSHREPFLDFLFKDEGIQQVTYIDNTGKEIFKIDRSRKISAEELRNRANEKGVSTAFLTGEKYIGPVFTVFTDNLEPMVNLIVPFKVAGEEKGAIEVILSLKNLWKKVGDLKVGVRGIVYIVNTNGMIIAHRDPTVVFSGAYVLDKDIVRKLVMGKQTADGSGPESRYLDINGNEVFGVGIPLEDPGWGVIAEQPLADAFAARDQIMLLAGISFGLSVVLLVIFQIIIRSLIKFTALLNKEKQKAEELSRDLEESKSILEVRIRARTRHLKELAENLEEKVKERTRELQERIDELEKFQKITTGRELKMLKLKEEIESLKEKLNQRSRNST